MYRYIAMTILGIFSRKNARSARWTQWALVREQQQGPLRASPEGPEGLGAEVEQLTMF